MIRSARRSLARGRWIALALVFFAWPRPARAHTTPYSYVDLRVQGTQLEGQVAAHVVDLGHELNLEVPEALLDSTLVLHHAGALEGLIAARLDARADGVPIRLEWTGFSIDSDRRLVVFAFRAALAGSPGRIDLHGPLFTYEDVHETYANVFEGGTMRCQAVLDHAHPSAVAYFTGRRGALAVFSTFVRAGMRHILIGPDHLLFIFGLLLLGGGAARLLTIVTAFTLSHSLTLALATLGVLNPPVRLIEPAIALSIVAVGIENLMGRGRRDVRPYLAFGFGLVHGFGFAGVLRDFGLPSAALGWSLFSFNLGVELGQAAVVLSVAPLLAALSARQPRLLSRVVTVGSALVITAGTYWLVQRVFFS